MARQVNDKVKEQNRWLRDLCSVEDAALKMAVPIDLRTCEPELIVCPNGKTREIFDYWRVVLSSEPQVPRFSGAGRNMALLVRDRVSGGFMGVIGLSDPPTHWTQMNEHLGWRENKNLRLISQHRLLMMRRCIPLYEFGGMTGGKLLALLATSRECIRLTELRFSFDVLLFGVRTLHGRGSQYNRLHSRGLEYLGTDETNHGFYAMELRKDALKHLRDPEVPYGDPVTYTMADQTDHWKNRWLASRMESTGSDGIIRPDPERYRLTTMMREKRKTAEVRPVPTDLED